MRKRGKILALCLCAVLLVASSVFVTIAYLTSQTETVTNTFTVGKVAITLDEKDVDVYGAVDGDERVKENKYKLIPGHTYTKDPTVHVDSQSEDCWLFVKVENGIVGIEGTQTIASQMQTNGWESVTGATNIYAYKDIATADKEADKDYVVFGNFTVNSTADVSGYADSAITITAYAIQAAGFETAADAWETSGF